MGGEREEKTSTPIMIWVRLKDFEKEKTNDTSNMVWGERWKYIFGANLGNEMEVEAFLGGEKKTS